MSLSIIVPWRDRVELTAALPSLIGAAAELGGEVVIVNFGGDAALLEERMDEYRDDVGVVTVGGEPWFNKARAQNVGAACSRHPLLFFCDCDIQLDPGMLADLAERVLAVTHAFATLAGVRESQTNSRGGKHVTCFGYELHIRTADGRFLKIVDNEEDADDGTRQAPGLLLVRREHFMSIGGYNSRLHGWGWDDQDMVARLTLGAGLQRICRGQALHISHDDDARMQAYPSSDRWENRDRMFRAALSNYDRADFAGTFRLDADEYAAATLERDVGPVPRP